MIPVLLDPWLLQFSSSDSNDVTNLKMGSLKRYFDELQNQHPLEVVPFLSQAEREKFFNNFFNCKFVADKMIVVRYVNTVSLKQNLQVGPARITDNPCPSLPESWLRALADSGSSDAPPSWRYPMVLLPTVRRSDWPAVDEINYDHEGSLKNRNLVLIEHYRDHKFFTTDIDPLYPWCLTCLEPPISQDGSLQQKQRTWKRLPCPPQLARTRTMQELTERLQQRLNFTNEDDSIFYIPDDQWRPLNISKQAWRVGSFPEKMIIRGPRAGKSGYLDRAGRIWVWHNEECHWDVQINDGATHINVSCTGKNLSY